MALNPNPHYFKTIAKVTACGLKEPVLLHVKQRTMGGGGEGGTVLSLQPFRFA
jgi:hypothetical protein